MRSISPPTRFSISVLGRTAYPSPVADLLSGVETPVADLVRWSKKLAPFGSSRKAG